MTPANGYRIVHAFAGGSDGFLPQADLAAVSGKLYGTTDAGGNASCFSGYGCGTVFDLTPSGTHRVIHRFSGYPHDGAEPRAGLITVNGALYGTTSSGSASPNYNLGTVYRISAAGQEKVVYSFDSQSDGRYSTAELVYDNGLLFGTTQGGGNPCYSSNTCGTVFGVTMSGTEKVLYRFRGTPDGASPYAGLTLFNHHLYGTTAVGGARFAGTLFEITTSGKESVDYSFTGGHYGAEPEAQLTVLRGQLYGTTITGGAYGLGAVHAISSSGKLRILHAFRGSPSDGAFPGAHLIVVNGQLYGTTRQGGAHVCFASGTGCGTVFSVSPSGTEKVLYSFAGGKDGALPVAGLAYLNATLYGTTAYGGSGSCPPASGEPGGCGTVFAITP